MAKRKKGESWIEYAGRRVVETLKEEWSTPENRRDAIFGFISHALFYFAIFGSLAWLNVETRYCLVYDEAYGEYGPIVFNGSIRDVNDYIEGWNRHYMFAGMAVPTEYYPLNIRNECNYDLSRWWKYEVPYYKTRVARFLSGDNQGGTDIEVSRILKNLTAGEGEFEWTPTN